MATLNDLAFVIFKPLKMEFVISSLSSKSLPENYLTTGRKN